MRLCGLTLLERLVRQHLQAGAERIIVRGEGLPSLPSLGVPVEVLAPRAALPEGALVTPGDEFLGIKVVDSVSRRRAERSLLETCRRPYDGLVDRYVVRYFSLRLTRFVAMTPLTPNQITVVSILSGLFGAVLAALGHPAIGAMMMVVQVILDSIDGELARLIFKGSHIGMIIDNVGDELVDNAFIAGVGIGFGGPWLVAGIVGAGLRVVSAGYLYYAMVKVGKDPDPFSFHPWFDDDTTKAYYHDLTPRVLLRAFIRRDFYTIAWTAFCVTGVGFLVVPWGLAMGIGYATILILHFAVMGKTA